VSVPNGVLDFYASGVERERLTRSEGLIEAVRTQELLSRFIQPASTILDVGGGPGFYADWLARQGHRVRLIDPVPLHVEEARQLAGDPPRFEADVGDARSLAEASDAFDVVLAMGPLYHLVEQDDRVVSLMEARRVCRPGGYVLATAISRYAPALHGVRVGWIADEKLFESVKEQQQTGRGWIGPPQGFSPAYFHSAEQLCNEAERAGLEVVDVFGIEGPGWLMPDFEAKWNDPAMRERLIWLAQSVESDPRMLGASAHLMLVARKPTA
jgi:SAM-dependent methyltransferase